MHSILYIIVTTNTIGVFIAQATTPPPAVDECSCMNGGTCVVRVIRGRRILRCACPDGYSGRHCENMA